jgi:hypothetical protein
VLHTLQVQSHRLCTAVKSLGLHIAFALGRVRRWLYRHLYPVSTRQTARATSSSVHVLPPVPRVTPQPGLPEHGPHWRARLRPHASAPDGLLSAQGGPAPFGAEFTFALGAARRRRVRARRRPARHAAARQSQWKSSWTAATSILAAARLLPPGADVPSARRASSETSRHLEFSNTLHPTEKAACPLVLRKRRLS